MNLPILLYDIENKQLPQNIISTTKSIFIRSYQYIGIKLLTGDAKIYSAKIVGQNPEVISGTVFGFTENFGYTIYLKTSAVFEIWTADGTKATYSFLYANEDEEINQIYIDKLTNAYLPQYKELLPAILKEGNSNENMKKLLMDYKSIMRMKGTRKGIELWLQYVGLDDFKVVEEYITEEGLPTTTPDKSKDYKSGNYYLIIDNSSDVDGGLTNKNMPIYNTQFENVEEFFERLFYALSLANIYFTLPEQDFTFFGLNYHANSMMFQSITNRNYVTYQTNPHYFHKKEIDVELNKKYDLFTEYLVKNKIYVEGVHKHTSTEFIKRGLPETKSLFTIDEEVFDSNLVEDDDLKFFQSKVGSIYNLIITAPNKYVNYVITSPVGFVLKNKSPMYVEESVNPQFKLSFFTDEIGKYKLTVDVRDHFNNRELYIYEWTVGIIDNDFDIYTTVTITEDSQDIISDIVSIESPSEVSTITNNPILKQNKIPLDLFEYYNVQANLSVDRFLTQNERYQLKDLNVNNVVSESTELPTGLIDNWLEILSIDITDIIGNVRLISKTYNPDTGEFEFTPINVISNLQYEPDKLFVTILDINEDDVIKKYMFISTVDAGIDIDFIYDLYITVDNTTYIKLNEIESYTSIKIPVNHNFKLFHKLTNSLNYPQNINNIVIKSVFPLMHRKNQITIIKLGDIILCKSVDTIKNTDLKWEVRNSFTDELVFESTDLQLKYRIEDNMIYKIVQKFNFNGRQYIKSKFISSFEGD